MRNYALVTYFNDAYWPGFQVMLKSFLKYNPWFCNRLVIYDWGISDENKEKAEKIYPKIIWKYVCSTVYNLDPPFMEKAPKAINFQKLELFELRHYKKIIVLDSDLVITDDISELFSGYNDGFYVGLFEDAKHKNRPDTGMMVIDHNYLRGYYRDALIADVLAEYAREDLKYMSNENVVGNVFRNVIQLVDEDYKPKPASFHPYCKIMVTPTIKPWKIHRKIPDNVTDIDIAMMFKLKNLVKKMGLNYEGD